MAGTATATLPGVAVVAASVTSPGCPPVCSAGPTLRTQHVEHNTLRRGPRVLALAHPLRRTRLLKALVSAAGRRRFRSQARLRLPPGSHWPARSSAAPLLHTAFAVRRCAVRSARCDQFIREIPPPGRCQCRCRAPKKNPRQFPAGGSPEIVSDDRDQKLR